MWITCAVLGVAVGAHAEGPSAPPASAALDAMLASFAKADAVRVAGECSQKFGDQPADHLTLQFAMKRPSFARYDFVYPGGGKGGIFCLADGKQFWTYFEGSKSYSATPIEPDAAPILQLAGTGLALFTQAYFDAPAIVAGKTAAPWKDRLGSATTSEADVAGEACTVVTMKMPNDVLSLSISTKTGAIRRIVEDIGAGSDGAHLEFDVRSIDASPKLDAETFVFRRPAAAVEVDGTKSPEEILLAVRAAAPDIGGDSPTAGKRLKLSDYRGKIVLLNFWFSH
ncbi:MAG: hypothetical protein HYR85_07875 [Planctomycetes bacterium]|nr:hypothetical protein [Planctomycetota bacterium]MBI3848157.1 hypothetical protein [Planctomycetota bacterium]